MTCMLAKSLISREMEKLGEQVPLTRMKEMEYTVSTSVHISLEFWLKKKILPSVLQGKIAGRGILLDFFSYSQKNGIKYGPNAYNTVTADDLEKCAQSQGVKFEQGDILFVRMGFIHWYENLATEEDKMALAQTPTKAVGIRQTMEEVEWMWYVPFI